MLESQQLTDSAGIGQFALAEELRMKIPYEFEQVGPSRIRHRFRSKVKSDEKADQDGSSEFDVFL